MRKRENEIGEYEQEKLIKNINNTKTDVVGEGDGELHVMGLVFAVGEGDSEGRDGLGVVGEETRHLGRLVLADAALAIHVCGRLEGGRVC